MGNVKHVGRTSLAYQLFSFSDYFFLMFKIVCWPAFRVYFRIYAHHLPKKDGSDRFPCVTPRKTNMSSKKGPVE